MRCCPTAGFDPAHPFRLTEADDARLVRVRGALSVLADLTGLAHPGSHVLDPRALHATLWLLHDEIEHVITAYTGDLNARSAA